MPIATSSVLNQLRNTSYTQTRVPFFPEDNWEHGSVIGTYQNDLILTGIFAGSGLSFNCEPIAYDSVGAFVKQYSTGLTNQTIGSYFSNYDFLRESNIKIKTKIRVNQTSDFRLFFGFADVFFTGLSEFGDDYLSGGYTGFGLLIQNGGNFKIISNDASENSNISSDIDTIDTNTHDLFLESDSDNNRFGYSWDNSNITYITSQIPDNTTPFNIGFSIIDTTAEQHSFDFYTINGIARMLK